MFWSPVRSTLPLASRKVCENSYWPSSGSAVVCPVATSTRTEWLRSFWRWRRISEFWSPSCTEDARAAPAGSATLVRTVEAPSSRFRNQPVTAESLPSKVSTVRPYVP